MILVSLTRCLQNIFHLLSIYRMRNIDFILVGHIGPVWWAKPDSLTPVTCTGLH